MPGVPMVTRRMALCIVEKHLAWFAQRDFNKLKKALDCDDEDLREAQAVIRQCNPHPGAAFASDERLRGAGRDREEIAATAGSVTLNNDVMPRLRVNALYASLLKQGKGESQMNAQLQEAKWLIKNMRQRFDTILRVAQAIVERQKNFFSHGAVAMRPLVLARNC
jgi:RNA polymerase sigma-54 factor